MALQASAPAEGPPEGIHSLGDIPRVHSRLTPQRPALAFEGRTTTYQQLDERASQVANGLIASGVKPGDRIAHLGKNSDFYLELLLGAATGQQHAALGPRHQLDGAAQLVQRYAGDALDHRRVTAQERAAQLFEAFGASGDVWFVDQALLYRHRQQAVGQQQIGAGRGL